jgi:hypothetical protein
LELRSYKNDLLSLTVKQSGIIFQNSLIQKLFSDSLFAIIFLYVPAAVSEAVFLVMCNLFMNEL